MTINMMVEKGHLFWQCDECDDTFFDANDFFYGHDCEVESE